MLRILLLLGTTVLCALAQTADFNEDISVYLTTKYIEDEGYVAETHHVTTEDGYILEMHRIPYPRNQSQPSPGTRPVAFLMHGLTSASIAYIYLGHEFSVAYNLADAGFDVWMGNQRGNKNSRHHVTLNPDDPSDRLKFFDFSWEEIGMYDLPAMIDYILNETGREKLHYIGHSQGGTVFFVLGSMRPEYNSKIASAHLLAGVGYQQYFPDPDLASAASLTDIIYAMAVSDGMVELFPPNTTEAAGYSALDACLGDVAHKAVCDQIGVRKYSIRRADANDDIITNNGTDTGNTDIGDNIGNSNITNTEENNGSSNGTDIDESIGNGNSTDIDDSNSSNNSTDVDDSISSGNGTDTDNSAGDGDVTDIEDNNGSGNGSDTDDNGTTESEDTGESESSIIDDYFTSSDAMGGGALKQVAHYGQNIRDKAFRRWNYGFFGNLGNYISINPPSYNLGLITCNVTMHYTVSDELLDERDVLDMAADMPNVVVRQVSRTSFLHGDFAGALDAKVLVTNYIIEAILYVEENLPVEEEQNISDGDGDTVLVVEEVIDSEDESEDDILDTNEDLTEDISEGGDESSNGNEDGNGNQDGNDNEGNENTDPVVEPVTDSSNSAVLSIAFKVYLILSSIYCIFMY